MKAKTTITPYVCVRPALLLTKNISRDGPQLKAELYIPNQHELCLVLMLLALVNV